MKKYTRRQFIKTSGGAFAAAAVPLSGLGNSKVTPSDRVHIGLIGCHSMGFGDLVNTLKVDGVVCSGLCDVDSSVLEERAKDIQKSTGRSPALYSDYRKMLEKDELDAVIIGTPDHWHCLAMVDALQAGKHVYVEKPLGNSIAAIDIQTEAAHRYGKVVQVGQEQRSGKIWQKVVAMVQAGRLGRIRTVNIWANFKYGMGPERVPDEPVPDGVNYDMWLGPAPKRSFNKNRFHGNWRFFWDYGGGLQTDWGAHLLDIPLWAMNIDGPPKSVRAIGGIFSGKNRAIEVADTQTTIYEFNDFNVVWQQNGGLETGPYNRNYGIAFVGNKGTIVIDREGWKLIPEHSDGSPVIDPVPLQKASKPEAHILHAANFIDCIRHNNKPNCPVEAGRLSAYYCHCGNIAHRTDETLKWDEDGQLLNQDKFSHLIKPEYRKPWKFPRI